MKTYTTTFTLNVHHEAENLQDAEAAAERMVPVFTDSTTQETVDHDFIESETRDPAED